MSKVHEREYNKCNDKQLNFIDNTWTWSSGYTNQPDVIKTFDNKSPQAYGLLMMNLIRNFNSSWHETDRYSRLWWAWWTAATAASSHIIIIASQTLYLILRLTLVCMWSNDISAAIPKRLVVVHCLDTIQKLFQAQACNNPWISWNEPI